jgi:hypothetical protein
MVKRTKETAGALFCLLPRGGKGMLVVVRYIHKMQWSSQPMLSCRPHSTQKTEEEMIGRSSEFEFRLI